VRDISAMMHDKKIDPGSGFTDLARESDYGGMPIASGDSPKKSGKKTVKYYYPSLYLHDVPIPDAKVGDVIEVTAKVRVEEKTERTTENGTEGSMELEVIGIKYPEGMSVEEPPKSDDDMIEEGLDEAMAEQDDD